MGVLNAVVPLPLSTMTAWLLSEEHWCPDRNVLHHPQNRRGNF